MKSKAGIRDRLRKESDETLVSSLSHSDPETQRRIAYELGRRGSTVAAAALRPLLASSDAEVRAAAAEALGQLNDNSSGGLLTELLADPTQPTGVRDTCAYALARIAYSPALETLIAALNDPAETVRSCASSAIAAIVSKSDFRPGQKSMGTGGEAQLHLLRGFEPTDSATPVVEFLRKQKTRSKKAKIDSILTRLRKPGWRTVKTYHSKSHSTLERFLSGTPRREADGVAEIMQKLLEVG